MLYVRNKLYSHLSLESGIKYYNRDIRKSECKFVKSFKELVEAMAKISYNNPDHTLFYRGQDADYQDEYQNSSLYPRIYRTIHNKSLLRKISDKRFNDLEKAGQLLVEKLVEADTRKMKKFKELKWAILQHYEVCRTPLLDVTNSLRVACSFADLNNSNEKGYVFVFGVPHINGSITYSSEEELLNIRLQSICPPIALRPYYQDGYLLGTFPHQEKKKSSLNFAKRLIAKFEFSRKHFWDKDFTPIPKRALYPDQNDKVFNICQSIKSEIPSE